MGVLGPQAFFDNNLLILFMQNIRIGVVPHEAQRKWVRVLVEYRFKENYLFNVSNYNFEN